jgi:hypothetical protein
MEKLKAFSTLLEPDARWANIVLFNTTTKDVSPITFNDHYHAFSAITLTSATPEDVQSQFNISKMLGIYTWLYYPLHQVAESKAFSTLEMALRLRFPEAGRPGLKKLLLFALKKGAISDDGFSHVTITKDDPTRYSKQLPDILPHLRNDLDHGSSTLHPDSISTLRICAEIINQLFQDTKKPSETMRF